jgi:two-component system cell cycle response regulator
MAISKRKVADWRGPEGGARFFSQIYPWIVAILGFLAFGVLVARQGVSVTSSVLLFATLCALAEFLVIRLPQGSLTASFVLVLLALLTEGPVGAALVIVIGSLVGYGLLRRQSPSRTLFYSGHYALASAVAGAIFDLTSQNFPHWLLESIHLPAVGSYVLAYAFLSQTLVWFRNRVIFTPTEPKFPKTDLLVAFLLSPPPLLLYYLLTVRDFSALLLVLFPLLAMLAAFRTYINIDTAYDEVRLLYEVSQDFMVALTRDETVQAMAQRICDGIRRMVYCDESAIYTLVSEASELRLVYVQNAGTMPPVVTPGRGLLGDIVQEAQGRILNNVMQEPLSEGLLTAQASDSLLVVPLFAQSAIEGWLVLGRRGRRFSAENLRLVSILAGQAGVLLKNAELYEQTHQLAQIDPLLDILNRKAFLEKAKRELGQAQLNGHRVAMIMIDIDDFRFVNNTYGHQVGDLVLQEVVQVLQASIRGGDMVGRYGGEEFLILLLDTDGVRAMDVAERMRRSVETTSFSGDGAVDLGLTISAGIAIFPDDALDLSALIRKADQATYLAKRTGKNRVCLHQEQSGEEPRLQFQAERVSSLVGGLKDEVPQR